MATSGRRGRHSLTPDPTSPCWQTIGVWSRAESRCGELAQVGHCRHCPVFMAAGEARLSHTPLEAGDLAQAAEFWAQTRAPLHTSYEAPLMIFRVVDEWFALSLRAIAQVAEPRPVHHLPHRGHALVRGVVNIRDQLYPCVCLQTLLGLRASLSQLTPPRRVFARMLVLEHEHGSYACAVEETSEVMRYTATQVLSAPATVSQDKQHFLRGMLKCDSRTIGLLDEDRLFAACQQACAGMPSP